MSLGIAVSAHSPGVLAEASPVITMAVFQRQVAAAAQRVSACAGTSAACQTDSLPTLQETVSRGADPGEFGVNWQWLREALEAAKTSSPADRLSNMEAAGGHLAEWAATAGDAASRDPASSTAASRDAPSVTATVPFSQARAAANRVLARGEFRAADGPSWLDRQVARLEDWFFQLFLSMAGVGSRNPWLAPFIEWSCFLLASAGLLFFVRRSLARQSLRIALGEGAATVRVTDRDAADWAKLAENWATASDWREAIHCLYWAAIASLEARRAWRANPARTPREYLRLLRPGSDAASALRELTRRFERVWYGYDEATESEFRAAQATFATIAAADLRSGAGVRHGGSPTLAPPPLTAGTV